MTKYTIAFEIRNNFLLHSLPTTIPLRPAPTDRSTQLTVTLRNTWMLMTVDFTEH